MPFDFDSLYVFYGLAAVSAALLGETIYVALFSKASYRKNVNRRLRLMRDEPDRETVLVALRRERGLTSEGLYALPLRRFNRLILQSGLKTGPARLLVLNAVAIAAGVIGGVMWGYFVLHAVAAAFALDLVLGLDGLEPRPVLRCTADDECGDDEDFRWCRSHPGFVWLGARSDADAAALLLCADAGIVPFAQTPFNDAGLPFRILKAARLGRKTVTPDLAGVKTWPEAVVTAQTAGEFAAALEAQAGRRTTPDPAVRDWALAQTARAQNAPLWERLRELGVK